MSYLHVFDMDGTLLQGTTASLELASRLGCLEELRLLEARFAAGEIDTRGFAAALYALWRHLTFEDVAAAFAAAPWMAGIQEVWADIRRAGERSLLITMSPDFFARLLLAWGVDEVHASGFPALPFRTQPDPALILTPRDKVRIVDDALARLGLGRDRCIAYGDSMSDAPLFQIVPTTVAVNGDSHISAMAAVGYEGGNLAEAYQRARAYVAAVLISASKVDRRSADIEFCEGHGRQASPGRDGRAQRTGVAAAVSPHRPGPECGGALLGWLRDRDQRRRQLLHPAVPGWSRPAVGVVRGRWAGVCGRPQGAWARRGLVGAAGGGCDPQQSRMPWGSAR
jgi:phosphoserine phosphatase